MWIGGAEGAGYRYEVLALTDGFLVRMRDIDTGLIEEGETRLFRTARVAFAHAQTMASIDRFAATLLEMQDAVCERAEARRSEASLRALQERLNDRGCVYRPTPGQKPAVCVLH